MPLRPAQVTIPILGLDTNSDPKNALPGTLDVAENVVFKRTAQGGAELRKRFGVTARTANIISGGAVPSGRRLAQLNDEQLLISNAAAAALYSWDPQSAKWSDVAAEDSLVSTITLPRATVATDPISSGVGGAGVLDLAVGGGYLCCAYDDKSGNARVVVINLATGVHVKDSFVGFSISPTEIRVAALATVFMIFACSSGTNNLVAKSIAYATPTTLSGETVVANDIERTGSGNFFDLIRNGTNDSVLLAYRSTFPNMTVIIWNANMTFGGFLTHGNVPDQGLTWLNWDFSDGNGYLAYISSAGGGLKTHTVRQSSFAITATTVNDAAVVAGRGMTGFRSVVTNNIFVQQSGGATRNLEFLQRSTGGAVFTYQRGIGLATKAFTQGGRYYLGAAFDNSDTPVIPSGLSLDERGYFILDVTATSAFSAQVVAKAFFGEGGGFSDFRSPGFCPAIDANRVAVPLRRESFTGAGGPILVGAPKTYSAQFMTLDFSQANTSAPAQIGESLYLPGGAVVSYDDKVVAEAGFHLIPEYPTLTPSNGASFLTSSSTYQACILWSYTDNRGQVHRSAPSQVASVVMGATDDTLAIACQTYRLKGVRSVYIEVYLSVSNGSTLFFVGRVFNDHTVDSVTFTTGLIGDANITQGPQLYTGDGSNAHVPLPPARLMASWRNRLFFAGTEDPTDLWVSDERLPFEGISFSDANVITMEKEGGAITELSEMDDRLIVFKRSSIYELVGGGPAPNGDGQFDQPARITATVGTVNPDSVIKTPQGLIFKSLRGFYLLPVGGGIPIRLRSPESFESLTVTGAAVMEDVEQVRFVTSSGTTLVYHFGIVDQTGVGRWTTLTGQSAVDCAIFGGKFVYLTSAGVVQEENTAWNDNGGAITPRVRFAWLSLAGIFGDVRLWNAQWLVEFMATFTLAMSMELDFSSTVVQSPTLAVTAASAVPPELKPARQDAAAYRFTLQETSTTEGFRLSALVLQLGAHGRLKPVAAAQRMT